MELTVRCLWRVQAMSYVTYMSVFLNLSMRLSIIYTAYASLDTAGYCFYYNSHFTKFYLLFTVLKIHEQHSMEIHADIHIQTLPFHQVHGIVRHCVACSLPRNCYIPKSCGNTLFYTSTLTCACMHLRIKSDRNGLIHKSIYWYLVTEENISMKCIPMAHTWRIFTRKSKQTIQWKHCFAIFL